MDIVKAHFDARPNMARHHIESFDAFLDELPTLLKVNAVVFELPKLYPNEARLLGKTYECCVLDKETKKVLACIPLVLQCKACLLKGMPPDVLHAMGEASTDPGGYFVIDGVERVLPLKTEPLSGIIYIKKKKKGVTSLKCLGVKLVRAADGTITLSTFALFVVLRALGLESDKDLVHHCVLDVEGPLTDLLAPCVHQAAPFFTRAAALTHLKDFDLKKIAPHETSLYEKACFVCHLVQKLLLFTLNNHFRQDPASCAAKRVLPAGKQVSEVFAKGGLEALLTYLRASLVLDRRSTLATVSALRKVECAPHISQWGFVDPCDDTLALMAEISAGTLAPDLANLDVLRSSNTPLAKRKECMKVLLNGALYGWTGTPQLVLAALRNVRRTNQKGLSVGFDRGDLAIWTAAGRFIRPVQVGDTTLDYLDAAEEASTLLSFQSGEVRELHKSMALGVAASLLPFPQHGGLQPVQHTVAAAGMYSSNYQTRFEKSTILDYGQTPLVRTTYEEYFGEATAQNCVVAVLSGFGHALVFNEGAVRRGLFRHTNYSTGVEKVNYRAHLALAEGGEFATRTGFKGVGVILPETDFPFMADGTRPDVLLNPALATPALLLELAVGWAHVVKGAFADATAFEKVALEKHDEVVLYDGRTGAPLTKAFVGVAALLFLRQTAAQSCARTPIDFLTKQSSAGVLYAEEDVSAACAHGMTATVTGLGKETNAPFVVDDSEGLPAVQANGQLFAPVLEGPLQVGVDGKVRKAAEADATFSEVRVPAAFRLLHHELRTMNVHLRVVTPSRVDLMAERKELPTANYFQNEFLLLPELNPVKTNTLWVSESGSKDVAVWFAPLTSIDLCKGIENRPSPVRSPFYNKSKLEVYENQEDAVQKTAEFFFAKNSGVFVRIKNNGVVQFNPVANPNYKAALPFTVQDTFLNMLRNSLKTKQLPPQQWRLDGCRVLTSPHKGHEGLAELYDMLCSACLAHKIGDCAFFLNTAGPVLDSSANAHAAVFSRCTSDAHCDLPIPTAQDWALATQCWFAYESEDGRARWENVLLKPVLPWAERKNKFVFSGEAPACPDSLRETLQTLSRGGVKHLEISLNRKPTVRVRDKTVEYIAAKEAPLKTWEELAKAKFAFCVEGDAPSDLPVLWRLGFCVLKVKSKYETWFEEAKGGAVGEKVAASKWHFLEINPDNFAVSLETTVNWCLANLELCERIAQNGRAFYETHFSRSKINYYMADLLNTVSGMGEVVPSPAKAQVKAKEYHKLIKKSGDLAKTLVLWPTTANEPLTQCLEHYAGVNLLVLQHAEPTRGGVINAGVHFALANLKHVNCFVLANSYVPLDLCAHDGTDVVQLGKSWRFTKKAFLACNGYPTFFDCVAQRCETVAVGMDPVEYEEATAEELALDKLLQPTNGLNSVQYKIVDHTVISESARRLQVQIGGTDVLNDPVDASSVEVKAEVEEPCEKPKVELKKEIEVYQDTLPPPQDIIIIHGEPTEAQPTTENVVYQTDAAPVIAELAAPESLESLQNNTKTITYTPKNSSK